MCIRDRFKSKGMNVATLAKDASQVVEDAGLTGTKQGEILYESIIDKGLVVAEATPDELKTSIGGDVITFIFHSYEDAKKAKGLVSNSEIENNELRTTVENGAERIPDLLNKLSENELEVVSVSANKPSLDDVFLQVTGYRLEGAADTEEELIENE